MYKGRKKDEKKDFFMDREDADASVRLGRRPLASVAEQLGGTGIRRACAD